MNKMVLEAGDTAFVLICTAMVMLMTPAVGLFYGGMVRNKNIISMIALSFISLAIVTIQWVTIGYTLSFGHDIGGLIGGLDYIGLKGVGMDGDGIPDILFMAEAVGHIAWEHWTSQEGQWSTSVQDLEHWHYHLS
jgi:Amt family ammonium transporter